jgi:hypothetical protein
MLQGSVSQKTLLAQLPFVEDVDAEIEALEQEKADAMERQAEITQAMMRVEANTPIQDSDV